MPIKKPRPVHCPGLCSTEHRGSFLLPPGAANVQVYQGAGFDRSMSDPIVICRGTT
jgi:hypothetical protein